MKKFLALVLALLMIAGSVSVMAFDDVPEDAVYAEAINDLQIKKVVAGMSETKFGYDELVTRWQMSLFMARALSGITDDADWSKGAAIFTDCTEYLGAIQYCFTKGVIKGTTPTTFAPNNNIVFKDGIIMAVRALGYEKEDDGKDVKKYNVTGATYWLPYYQKADELGLLANLESVAIDKAMTRAETAQLIFNMLYTEVYSATGNDNKYTLNDVVFGGKKVLNVENVVPAFIYETPLHNFNADTIDDDEEIVKIGYYDADGDLQDFELEIKDLAKFGVTVENVEDYFGAYIELVNVPTDKDGDINYGKVESYEYLNGLSNANKLKGSNADVTYYEGEGAPKASGKLKIGNKTHYLTPDSSKKSQTKYEIEITIAGADGTGKATFDEAKYSDLEDKFYDAIFYDTDDDGYYEYAIVFLTNVATYTEASAKGIEKCGVMKGMEDVEYSEELDEDDIFVYTYDPYYNFVNVQDVLVATSGTINSYKQTSKTVDGVKTITGYVTIDGEKYTINDANPAEYFNEIEGIDDLLDDSIIDESFAATTSADLRAAASENIGEKVDFYLYNDAILTFGKLYDEADDVNYLVARDFTDFELGDYVVVDAFIDGADKEIKVAKITKDGKTHDITKIKTYGKLATALDGMFGIYTYTVNKDGFYTLKQASFKLKVSDYVKDVDKNGVLFYDYSETSPVDNKRENIIRITSSTLIAVIDTENETVKVVPSKAGKEFTINVPADALFYVDKIGFGDPDENHPVADIPFGKASVLFFQVAGDAESLDYADYKMVFVTEAVEDKENGTALSFELDSDEDTDKYTKFTADTEAFLLATGKDVADIYVPGKNADLEAGVYLLDDQNIVVDYISFKGLDTRTMLNVDGKEAFLVGYKTIKSTDINLYGYNYIRIEGIATSDTPAIKTVKFVDFNENTEDGGFDLVTKTNSKLVKYLEDEYAKGAKVVFAPNTRKAANNNTSYPSNTFTGYIINNLVK